MARRDCYSLESEQETSARSGLIVSLVERSTGHLKKIGTMGTSSLEELVSPHLRAPPPCPELAIPTSLTARGLRKWQSKSEVED